MTSHAGRLWSGSSSRSDRLHEHPRQSRIMPVCTSKMRETRSASTQRHHHAESKIAPEACPDEQPQRLALHRGACCRSSGIDPPSRTRLVGGGDGTGEPLAASRSFEADRGQVSAEAVGTMRRRSSVELSDHDTDHIHALRGGEQPPTVEEWAVRSGIRQAIWSLGPARPPMPGRSRRRRGQARCQSERTVGLLSATSPPARSPHGELARERPWRDARRTDEWSSPGAAATDHVGCEGARCTVTGAGTGIGHEAPGPRTAWAGRVRNQSCWSAPMQGSRHLGEAVLMGLPARQRSLERRQQRGELASRSVADARNTEADTRDCSLQRRDS